MVYRGRPKLDDELSRLVQALKVLRLLRLDRNWNGLGVPGRFSNGLRITG